MAARYTNFQHLSRSWDIQRRDGAKLTDFAGLLENTIREAAVHIKKNKYKTDNNTELTVDTLFSIIGVMLMSDKVKTWNSNIYPHLVKTMDNHYTVSGIACEVKKYLDRSIKSDNTTSHDNTYYTHRPQQSSRGNVSIKQKQPLRTSKQPLHSQQMSWTTPNKRDHYQAFRDRDHNPEPAICKNYTRGRTCFHGRNCPNCHLPLAHPIISAKDDDTPSINIEEQDL